MRHLSVTKAMCTGVGVVIFYQGCYLGGAVKTRSLWTSQSINQHGAFEVMRINHGGNAVTAPHFHFPVPTHNFKPVINWLCLLK